MSTAHPSFVVEWQPVSFLCFCSLRVGFLHRVRCRSFDSRRQPHYPVSVAAGTWTTVFTISCRPQKPRLGAFEPLVFSVVPGHLRPQCLPGGVALVRMWCVVWASIALDIQPILVPAFDSISRHGFSFRIACIRCPISVYRQPFDRRPCGLLPRLYV